MSPLRVRRERLDDDTSVVRGGRLSAESVHQDAVLCFRRFGEHGISVLRASHEADLERLAAGRLRHFEVLTVLTVGTLRRTGLEVRPTFRSPHCSVMLPDPENDIERLLACENTERQNTHYEPPEW